MPVEDDATAGRASVDWMTYDSPGCWDEMVETGRPRDECRGVADYLASLSIAELEERQRSADLVIEARGITFTVYSEAGNIDRAWPFDVIPRVIASNEWRTITTGLVQRLTALNLFIDDLYGAQKVVKDGVFPVELLDDSVNFRRQCIGMKPKFGVWAHICGSDLIRDRRCGYRCLWGRQSP